MRKVRFKETPKVLRTVRVSFSVGGKKVSFLRAEKVRKTIGVKHFKNRLNLKESKPDASTID